MEEFRPVPAQRGNQPLNIALEGPPGGGKTGSALLIAQGIQDVRSGPIRLIDTEARRSTKYVGESISGSKPFAFEIIDLKPPYRADRFKAAILAAIETKPEPACVIIDSASDEHEGIGGRVDWHEQEVTAMLERLKRDPTDWRERDKLSMSGWRAPSAARNDLVRTILQIHVPLIWTFRAREKTKPVAQKDDKGREKTVPTNIGFVPIAPAELVHAMDLVCLLPPRADGVPTWNTERFFEDFILKLPHWFKPYFAEPGPITPAHGRAMALWAAGVSHETPKKLPAPEHPHTTAPAGAAMTFGKLAQAEARKGLQHFNEWVKTLPQKRRDWIAERWDDFVAIAQEAQL
jgi:hypothetical protein